MKVLTLFPPCRPHIDISTVLASRQFVIDKASSTSDCLRSVGLKGYEGILIATDRESYGNTLLLIKLLRQEQPNAAIFVLESRLNPSQRLRLFEAGVDDCVQEPAVPLEFAFRLGVSIRLRQAASNLNASKKSINVLRSGDLELDLMDRTVTHRGRLIALRPKEFLLLHYLVRNANRSVTRTMILENVWNSSFEGLTNIVDVYISSLRAKLNDGSSQELIETKRGIGYTFIGGLLSAGDEYAS